MESKARAELSRRLADVDELVEAHGALTGTARGRRRKGPAITRAGVVLLTAAMEAFVEELFEEACDKVFAVLADEERKALYKETSRRLNTANVQNTNLLFFNLGVPWILSGVRWQNCSNAYFCERLDRLIETRGRIAHGKQPVVWLGRLRAWKTMVEKYAEVLERKVADHIESTTGKPSGW